MSRRHLSVVNSVVKIRWVMTACLLGCLLSTGCKDERPDDSPRFFGAVHSGNLTEVKALVSANPQLVSATDKMEATGLTVAIWNNNLPMVRFLIAAGSDVSRDAPLGRTPLHHAAEFGHTDIMRELLDAGADCNASSEADQQLSGLPPLASAAMCGHADAVELLLEYGADVNLGGRFDEQDTMLHHALFPDVTITTAARLRILTLLLDAGADVNTRGRYGRTPLWSARHTPLMHSTIVDLLVERGGTE